MNIRVFAATSVIQPAYPIGCSKYTRVMQIEFWSLFCKKCQLNTISLFNEIKDQTHLKTWNAYSYNCMGYHSYKHLTEYLLMTMYNSLFDHNHCMQYKLIVSKITDQTLSPGRRKIMTNFLSLYLSRAAWRAMRAYHSLRAWSQWVLELQAYRRYQWLVGFHTIRDQHTPFTHDIMTGLKTK